MNLTPSGASRDTPVVEEVRAIRKAIEEECGNDIEKLGEYFRRVGEEYKRTRAPVPRLSTKGTPPADQAA